MDEKISTGTRVGLGTCVLVLIFVVYAQTHLDDMVAFAQWVTETVVEDGLGVTKEMLEGK